MAGIGFSRYRFRGSRGFQLGILVTQLFPLILLVTPYYVLMSRFGLIDKHLSLIITYCAFTLPFCVWMLNTYFHSVPVDMEESAMIDGCSRMRIYWEIMMPLAKPAAATLTIFTFLTSWNDFFDPLIFINDRKLMTLPLALSLFTDEAGTAWHHLMSASVMATLPLLIVFFLAQRQFIEGVAMTGLKD